MYIDGKPASLSCVSKSDALAGIAPKMDIAPVKITADSNRLIIFFNKIHPSVKLSVYLSVKKSVDLLKIELIYYL